MTIWYVRPDTSHGSTRDGTTSAKAFGGWSEIVWASLAAGDTLYLEGTFSFATTQAIGAHNGTSGNPVLIRGDGNVSGAIHITVAGQTFTPRSNTKLLGITFTAVSRAILSTGSLTYFTLDGCTLNGGTNPTFTLSSATGHSHTDIIINNCTFYGGNDAADLGSGAAIGWFVSTALAISTITRFTITNSRFINVNPLGTSRGVISLRTEEDTDATSIVTDLIITENTFRNNRGYTIEAVDGHSFGAASPQYGLWKGIKVINNTIENQTADDSQLLGGGCAAFGFGTSPTASFGPNIISDNVMNNLEGQCGGINVGYGTYTIQRNKILNIKTYSIDGCGILLDDGIKYTTVSHNYIYNCPGISSAINSGAGIMFLNTESSLVYSNIINGCKTGIYFGSPLAGSYSWAFNNTFLNCASWGIRLSASADRTACKAVNNLFHGVGQGTNYSVEAITSTWLNENYNCFYNFSSNTANHTLGANSFTTNPNLSPSIIPGSTSILKATGLFIKPITDYKEQTFNIPPSIGAYEHVPVRGSAGIRGTR